MIKGCRRRPVPRIETDPFLVEYHLALGLAAQVSKVLTNDKEILLAITAALNQNTSDLRKGVLTQLRGLFHI